MPCAEIHNTGMPCVEIPYIGIIHCALYKHENICKMFIVDGQHRFYAYKKLYENKKDFYIQFVVKVCSTKEDVIKFFKALNNNYNLHEIMLVL